MKGIIIKNIRRYPPNIAEMIAKAELKLMEAANSLQEFIDYLPTEAPETEKVRRLIKRINDVCNNLDPANDLKISARQVLREIEDKFCSDLPDPEFE